MSTDVGSIVGYLRLDGTQFREEIAAAITELRALSGQTVSVDVKSDGLKAIPSMARVAGSSLDDLARMTRNVEDATLRVNVAEQRLNDLTETGKAKQSQLMSAQMALTKARRAEQDAIMATYSKNLLLAGAEDANAASAGRAESATRKLAGTNDSARQSTGLLITAIGLLGPALVPVAVGAAGLALGFAGMGAAGIAAVMGIKSEMAAGTNVGVAYTAGMDRLKGALTGIEQVAARNVLGNFQNSVSVIMAQVPTLTTDIGQLATITGKTASAVIDGLVKAFVTLAPYMAVAATDILNFVTHLAPLGGNNGLKIFAQNAVAELPKVLELVSSLVTLSVKLLASLLPFGTVILDALQMFVGALDKIPVGMLTQLAQLALSVFAGFKAWESITGIVEGVVSTLKGLNSTLEISEGVLSNASMAASVIGIAIAAFSLILAHNATVAEEATARQEAYADSVRASNGAIDEGVRAAAAKALEDEKALALAEQLGIALPDVTSAVLGQKDATDRVNSTLDYYIRVGTRSTYSTYGSTTSMNDNAQAAKKLKDAIDGQSSALSAQIREQKATQDASRATAAALTDQEQKTQRLATTYHMSVSTYQAAVKAQQQDAASLAATTAKMQMENDAAGLLKDALDRLNGKAISAAQAQQQFDSSLVSMTHAQNSAGKNVEVTTRTINSQTAAAVQVRGSLLQQVQALQNVVEANGGLSNSTGRARSQMMTMRDEIIRNAVAHGVDRAAVTAYIDKILQIPKSVPPTKLQVDKAAALAGISDVQARLNAVSGRHVTEFIDVRTNASSIGGAGGHSRTTANFRGGVESFRDGGFREAPFQSFAAGKLPSQAMIAPDGANLVQWAETGTGDEAFIPLGSGNHARSVAIWEEAGRRLGTMGAAAGAGAGLVGIEISGTLDTPWGPSQIKGVVRSELQTVAAQSKVNDRLRNGVSRP